MTILEDLRFCDRLVQVTRPALVVEEVITDARKFVKMGIWRSFARVFIIILCYQLRLPFTARKFFSDIRE